MDDVVLICIWGCDDISALPEYKQASGCKMEGFKSVFMASVVQSNWRCYEIKSQFSDIDKTRAINDYLSFEISPLHARIKFMDHFLHIAYDLNYGSVPENQNKPSNEELKAHWTSEKSRIQAEFKTLTGLNIVKPLSTGDFEMRSNITGINKDLLEKINILLIAINSKHKVEISKHL